MNSFIGLESKEIWGFPFVPNKKESEKIKKFSGKGIKKILDQCMENNWEFQFRPNIPCLFIKTGIEIWHYLTSQREAEDFQRNLKFYIKSLHGDIYTSHTK